MFSQFLGELPPLPPPPPARFWTEDQIVRFKERDYRIVTRLGSGGVGITFKVVEIDHINHEEIGSYVAKVAHNKNIGERAIKAYSLVRSHLGRHPNLSTIFEVANECYENQILSIMTWIEGSPLSDFIGVLPLLAEDQQAESTLHLIKRWLQDILNGLSILHKNGLIHGDVSPKNLIVSGSDLVLTDYDFITKVGDSALGPATEMYCAMSCINKEPVSPADDIYALAASFFHVLFEKEPFQNKHSGLSWENIDVSEMSDLTDFMNQATNPDPKKRFRSTSDALAALKVLGVNTQIDTIQNEVQKEDVTNKDITVIQIKPEPRPDIKLTNQKVTWLLSLLQSYPGSCWGNQETRGLDSSFAISTYVPTKLEDELFGDIEHQRVRLVILCGNAGDGKTALLQHLADRLGLGEHHSSNRIFEGKLKNRSLVRMNLDGSAAWNGRSADELMDEFLTPFQNGPPKEDIVHLLAINDGRLLEWIENQDETPLIIQLNAFLQDIQPEKDSDSYIKFINLNHRSLVGGIQADRKSIQILFLGRLLDQLYGGDKSSEIWAPCDSCTAKKRCEVVRAASIFGPETLPYSADIKIRSHARKRLYDALQAVHLKGETHITIRELRSTLVYILFGIHYCQDYHNGLPEGVLPYWDRVFMPEASGRQGELLHELPFFDPALEAHPKIDRYLINNLNQENPGIFPHYDSIALESARRRAYFEWEQNQTRNVAKQRDNEHGALDLAKGRYLNLFKKIPLENEEMNGIKRDEICAQLCKGISSLEDLPYRAFDRKNCVPLRITPKTPTETAFWVEKPLTNFRIYPDIPNREKGIDLLHRHIFLVYKYRNGQEEKLRIGADLFYLLLELGDGYQLGDASSEDTFANLSIFVQRLVREDEHELMAWNPIDESNLYKITAKMDVKKEGANQQFVLNRLE
jgi:serine/threonine protein kinase